jgi:hypothetical protein
MKRSTSLDACKTIQIQKGLMGAEKILIFFFGDYPGTETKRRNKKRELYSSPFQMLTPKHTMSDLYLT